jgi:hypothetical protein
MDGKNYLTKLTLDVFTTTPLLNLVLLSLEKPLGPEKKLKLYS